jgi:transposase
MPVPYDIGVRIQALAFLQLGVPVEEIQRLLGPSKAIIYRWCRTVITRGYNSEKPEKILLEYLVNKPRSGRPRKATVKIKEKIIKILIKSSVICTLTGLEIGLHVGVLPRTVQHVLKRL